MTYKLYEYANCSTCRKARKFLDSKRVSYEVIPIREKPPSKAELKKMLRYCDGDIRRLFNTSGGDYKAMGLKDGLKTLSENELLDLLSKNGNLVKRPFLLSEDAGLVGFKDNEWAAFFGN